MAQTPYIPPDMKHFDSARRKPVWKRGAFRKRLSGVRRPQLRKRWYALSAASLCGVLIFGLMMDRSTSAAVNPDVMVSQVIDVPTITQEFAGLENDAPFDETALELSAPATPEFNWQTVTVKKGETLGAIFKRKGLSARTVHNVVHASDEAKRLVKIFPGDELKMDIAGDDQLRALEYQLDETSRLRLTAAEGGFVTQIIAADIYTELAQASGKIDDSLFLAGRRAGLTDKLIMDLAGLFGWDIDFVLDIRKGDTFQVIYEKVYREGEYLRTGDIVAASFTNQGNKYEAIQFETSNGKEYFSPDGRNMKKAFLRAPLNFRYISSAFNPKRFHPVLKRVKAHNGIDYYAPKGTPVYASGNGKVIRSSYSKYNGHHVFIQHGNNIVTKYLHFTKRAVKNGARVKQGDVIGYVGATGLASGPHLHYEFVVNGVHRNPRTVKLPKAEPLPAELMPRFESKSGMMLAELARLETIQAVAATE